MSENTENANVENESVVDAILGGESHSPKDTAIDVSDTTEVQPQNQEEKEAPEKTDNTVKDSAEIEKNLQIYRQQVDNLTKRLHDTQSAFHRETEYRSRLEKELQSLKDKSNSDDDWFSEEDKAKVKELDSELENSKKSMEQLEKTNEELQNQAASAAWEMAAAQVEKEHPDFQELVYGQFVPLMEKNAQVKAMYDMLDKKDPASVYELAKNIEEKMLIQNDIEAYKAKVRAEIEAENKQKTDTADTAETSDKVEGKDGLDLLNSADIELISESDSGRESAVDFVFK